MKTRTFMFFLLLGLSTLFFSCDGGNGGTTGPTTTYNVSGQWCGTQSRSDGTSPGTFTMDLVQSGSTVTGNINDSVLGTVDLSGSVSDRTINFSIPLTTPLNGTGTISDDGNTMSGTWTQGQWTGIWEARRC